MARGKSHDKKERKASLMEDKKFLKMAVEQAKKSVDQGGFPAGAVVVKDGKVISEGISIGDQLHDPTEHAETSSIRKACKFLGSRYIEGAILYESLECCNMCFLVAYHARISRIVFACRKTQAMVEKSYYEGKTTNESINQSNNRKVELVFVPDFEQESLKIVKEWEEKQV